MLRRSFVGAAVVAGVKEAIWPSHTNGQLSIKVKGDPALEFWADTACNGNGIAEKAEIEYLEQKLLRHPVLWFPMTAIIPEGDSWRAPSWHRKQWEFVPFEAMYGADPRAEDFQEYLGSEHPTDVVLAGVNRKGGITSLLHERLEGTDRVWKGAPIPIMDYSSLMDIRRLDDQESHSDTAIGFLADSIGNHDGKTTQEELKQLQSITRRAGTAGCYFLASRPEAAAIPAGWLAWVPLHGRPYLDLDTLIQRHRGIPFQGQHGVIRVTNAGEVTEAYIFEGPLTRGSLQEVNLPVYGPYPQVMGIRREEYEIAQNAETHAAR